MERGGQIEAALSPVRGGGASPGLAAEHHLPAVLHRLHRVHDAAWLLGEDGTLQDAALCRTTRKHNTAYRATCAAGWVQKNNNKKKTAN